MKNKIIVLLLLVASQTFAQDLYLQTFGDQNANPIIYLHGGPGYNSSSFEGTTAEKLSEAGHFVIVYDRRGEGRSEKLKATYTFEETITDLVAIYEKYDLEKATLLGHSFGGIIATLFAEKYPNKIEKIVLLSAPVSLQSVFQTIIDSTEVIYRAKKDSVNLNYIEMLKKMDKASLAYSSYCFMHAMANGFYTPKEMTETAKEIYTTYSQSELFQYANQMSYVGPQGFWENEQYTSIDLTKNLLGLREKEVAIVGIYGKEDGVFAKEEVARISKLIGRENMFYLENCSHNPYLDQQKEFIEIIRNM